METIKSIVSILVAALALTFMVQNVSGQSNATTLCKPELSCDTFCCAMCNMCLKSGITSSNACANCQNNCNQ